MGQRLKRAVLQAAQHTRQSITHVAIVGLANQYISYFTTPEEYALQHYEGLDLIWSGQWSRHCRTAGLPGDADGCADYASCFRHNGSSDRV